MFDDLVISSVHPNKTNKPWTVFLSTVVQAGIVGFMILLPLIYTCLLYTSPSPRDSTSSRMPSSA